MALAEAHFGRSAEHLARLVDLVVVAIVCPGVSVM